MSNTTSITLPPLRRPLGALTGLRFMAATYVMVFHFCPSATMRSSSTFLARFVERGPTAVSLFFVLSGFILAYNYASAVRCSSVAFYWARFARIYPAYLFALLMMLPFYALTVYHAECDETRSWHLISGVLVLTLAQAWIPVAALSWNAPGWSLSCEAFFYVCFPWLGTRLGQSGAWSLPLIAVLAWTASFVVPVWCLADPTSLAAITGCYENDLHALVAYNPLVRLPEFVVGVAVGTWHGRHADQGTTVISRRLSATLTYVAVIGLAASLAFLPCGMNFSLHNGGLLVPWFVMLIVGLAGGGGLLGGLFRTRLFEFMGETSYALYLVHSAVGHWLRRISAHVGGDEISPTLLLAVEVASAICLSVGIYLLVEVPARRWLRHHRPVLFS